MYYIYVYLDQRYPGAWTFQNYKFTYKPFYIGKGTKNRIDMHLMPSMLKTKSIKSSVIKSIINELGEAPIHYRLIENLNEHEAFELEQALIKHFGRQDIGTGILANHTSGGEGSAGGKWTCKKSSRKVYQYSLEGMFLKEWTTKELAIQYEGSCNLSTCIKRKGTMYGYQWSYDYLESLPSIIKCQMPIKYKNIKQIDPKTGGIVNTFATALDVERILKLRSGARNKIYECLKGNLKTYKGYEWQL